MSYQPVPLNLPSGVVKEDSPFTVKRRYTDSQMVHFWKGAPERWKGWVKHTADTLDGPARANIAWRTNAGVRLMAFGTAEKLWLLVNNTTLYDITPVGLPAGLVDAIDGAAWGMGGFGSGVWGGATYTVVANGGKPRTWTLSLWGEDLIAVPRGGTVYQWVAATGYGVVAAAVAGAPATCLGAFVTDVDRHLVVYGAHNGVTDDTLLLKWPSQETLTDWAPTLVNTAGDTRAERGNEIMAALEVRGTRLIFTDTAVYTFRYIGGEDVFELLRQTGKSGLIGPNAAIELDGKAYWMGDDFFYSYDGVVAAMPCDVHKYVFDNLNRQQAHKVYAGVNRGYNEVIWYYPDNTSIENNRYVAFNDDGWSIGALERTSWLDDNISTSFPVATTADGLIYRHETGSTADGESILYRLETGDMSQEVTAPSATVGVQMSRKVLPDYQRMEGDHTMTIEGRRLPRSAVRTKGPYAYNATTEQFSARSRAALYRYIFEGNGDFRMGTIRVMNTRDGGR